MFNSIMECLLASYKHNLGVRITFGDRWLMRDVGVWVVYERKPYQKKTRIIISTEDEKEAINDLIGV